MPELSVKERLEARVHIRQIIQFEKLVKILKSLGHTCYIQYDQYETHIDCINPQKYPDIVKIISIVEKEYQIWSMGNMIKSTHIKIGFV
jgi:hypothetical protein